jgi:cell wall-associated NlpC family hydrolase
MRHYRIRRYGRRRLTGRETVAAVAVGGLMALAAHHGSTAAGQARASTVTTAAAAAAIAYARSQLGKPYLWGGTGPDAFDCSGLVMQAYAAAGIGIPRTSEEQWAAGPQVSTPRPGDLVFFAGADGASASPGHVGLVIGNGEMIEAYATGFPIRISVYGTASSPPGDQDPVGFTDPAAHAGTS